MTMNLTCTSVLFAAALFIFDSKIISVGAFGLQSIGAGTVTFRGNIRNTEKKLAKSNCFRSWNIDGDEMHISGENCSETGREAKPNTLGNDADAPQCSRNQFLFDCRSYFAYGFAASTAWSTLPEPSTAMSYSENAKNLDRINSGDFSGGAVFDNNPSTDRGKKRRAMTGCKTPLSREEASKTILKRDKMMSEKECNQMVMDGETEFMLQALRNLDCPTCAYGIGRMD
eukprot:CAMPEP_0172385280 /NCGR_PEP_ID=MMETSP1061-20121228/2949_1 /TAXON_ID=37318 /ORGANISM="Pseudo-nitzschia pungens, Strain cf. pungens" /LENGTH=227 /DNA_ID=CAMNT_0013114227 /DNA_START=107 /DNA_END=790 /DNA_ORIENTATION=+